jgi:hypothetical protein
MGIWTPLGYGVESVNGVAESSFLSGFSSDARLKFYEDRKLALEVSFFTFVCLADFLSTNASSTPET